MCTHHPIVIYLVPMSELHLIGNPLSALPCYPEQLSVVYLPYPSTVYRETTFA